MSPKTATWQPRHIAWSSALVLALAMLMAGLFASASAAELRAGDGLLTVTASPSVATQITVGDVARNTEQIRGLALPAGEHQVCFSGPEDYLVPECQTAVVVEGETTSIVGEFHLAVWLNVAVEPEKLRPDVSVNGVARDRSPMRIPVAAGEHEVCFEELAGYEPVECQSVDVEEGDPHSLVVAYEPIVEPDPEPEPEPTTDVSIVSASSFDERGPNWRATVEVNVTHDGVPTSGVLVEANWSLGSPSSASCVTAADGSCSFTRTGIHNRDGSITLTIVRLDGGSTSGPSVTVSR